MANVIEQLRKHSGLDGYTKGEAYDEIDELLIDVYKPEGYVVEEVHTEFEEGGRWSNYETTVYKVIEGKEVAYFSATKEEPATESQWGMDLSFNFYEVEPKEVTVTTYVSKGGR